MSVNFRSRYKKKKSSLHKRHSKGAVNEGGRYPSILLKDKIPAGVDIWSCKEGDHYVDIIPFIAGKDMPFDSNLQPITDEGDLDYVLQLAVHQNIGAMKTPFVCPFENFGLPCPICEYIKANKLEKEDWAKIATKKRVLYFVWVHDTRKDEKKGLQIWEASWHLVEKPLAGIAKLPRGGGYVDFSDIDTGKSLSWERVGKGRDTEYVGHKLLDREGPIPDRILDQTFPLDSIVNMHPSYNEINEAFLGTLKEMKLIDEEEEEEEEGFDDRVSMSAGDDVPLYTDEERKNQRYSRRRKSSDSSSKRRRSTSTASRPVRRKRRRR